MRIAISGTSNMGKSTLIKDFLAKWPAFRAETMSYRDLFKIEDNSQKIQNHSKHTNKDTQWKILNVMVDELQKYKKTDKVVFDRCPLDNLVYSLWSCDKKTSDIDEEFIQKCIPIVKESFKMLDIIFLLPITRAAPVPVEENGVRETDEIYRTEIDHLFKGLYKQYALGLGRTPFFPADDCPAIIEIFGNRQERLEMMKLYLDADGDLIGGDVNAADNLFNPQNLEAMANLLTSQKKDAKLEKDYKQEIDNIKKFVKQGTSKPLKGKRR